MASFQSKNKNYKLLISNNTIIGRFGFSLTEESIKTFLYSFYNFLMNYGYTRVCLGQDGTAVVDSIFKEVVVPTISLLGVQSSIPEGPTPLPQFVWFCQESQKTSIGLYFKSINIDENIEIDIYSGGKPIDKEFFQLLLKSSSIVNINTLDGYESEDPQYFNLDGYYKWLLDSKNITHIPASINIDTMYGSSCYFGKTIQKQIGLNVHLFNIQTDPPRFKNYIAKPTGQFLSWFTTYPTVKKDQFYFGLNSSGSSLGLYDLTQNLEISSAGVSLLLLKYLKEVKKSTDAFILVSTGLNSRVISYIKKLNYKYRITNLGLGSVSEELKGGRCVDLYLDEQGGFYCGGDKILCTNPFIAIFRIIELCKQLKKSPGEVIDDIYLNDIPKLIYHNNFYLLKSFIDKYDLIDFLNKDPDLKNKKESKPYTIFKFNNKSKLTVKDNIRESLLEVFIESKDPTQAKELGNKIDNFIKQKINIDKTAT